MKRDNKSLVKFMTLYRRLHRLCNGRSIYGHSTRLLGNRGYKIQSTLVFTP